MNKPITEEYLAELKVDYDDAEQTSDNRRGAGLNANNDRTGNERIFSGESEK